MSLRALARSLNSGRVAKDVIARRGGIDARALGVRGVDVDDGLFLREPAAASALRSFTSVTSDQASDVGRRMMSWTVARSSAASTTRAYSKKKGKKQVVEERAATTSDEDGSGSDDEDESEDEAYDAKVWERCDGVNGGRGSETLDSA